MRSLRTVAVDASAVVGGPDIEEGRARLLILRKRLCSSNDAPQLSALNRASVGLACRVSRAVCIGYKPLGVRSDMDSVQVVKDSGQNGTVHADFVKGQVVHFDGVDPVTHMLLHPLPHFTISDVGQVFDGTPELRGVRKVVRSMVKQERGNLGWPLETLTDVGHVVLVRRFGEVAIRRKPSRRREGYK